VLQVNISDLKPANVGKFNDSWKLIDHDMMSKHHEPTVQSFGTPPSALGPGWIADTRWASLVTCVWPSLPEAQRQRVLTTTPDALTLCTAEAERLKIGSLLVSVGIIFEQSGAS